MSPSTVFVTGAAGFIGSRLAHRLALETDAAVCALVHNVTGPGAMRLGRLPIDIEQGSVLDRGRMDELVAGCDAVVHCAFGGRETTVDGTRNLLEVADRHGVEEFVHMSTAAVHGIDFDRRIDESAPFDPQTPYARHKADAERFVTSFTGANGMEPVVLRPFIVYGPYANFVERPLAEIQTGAVLAEGGFGSLNQTYVDNLVDAIVLSLEEPAADGEVFLCQDDEDVSWRQYYHRLATMSDEHPPIRDLSRQQIQLRRALQYVDDSVKPPVEILKLIAANREFRQRIPAELNRAPWARRAFEALSSERQADFIEWLTGNGGDVDGASAEDEYVLPDRRYEALHASRGRGTTTRLKETLGWRPQISFDAAMDRIERWAVYEELV